ncbi:MAG: hypothetical protein WC435_02510 [Candidatus Paceibacterota bacterium]
MKTDKKGLLKQREQTPEEIIGGVLRQFPLLFSRLKKRVGCYFAGSGYGKPFNESPETWKNYLKE